MKPASFEYERPTSISDAITLLTDAGAQAKVIAGGQSLGPMMNMRLARPGLLVDITQIPELTQVTDSGDHLVFGACITHAAIEDGRVDDATNNMMPTVAAGIAYRAVRNRGTIGGSLVHADPAADWITTLTLFGAEIEAIGPKGTRRIALEAFMNSAFDITLKDDEILTTIHVPKFSSDAQWGYYKFCRKTGEFADGMSAVLIDRERNINRIVIGATDTRPIVIADAAELIANPGLATKTIGKNEITNEKYLEKIHSVCLKRAIERAKAS